VVLDDLTVLQTVVHRVFWAAICMWLYLLARGERMPITRRLWGAFLVMGLLNNVLPFLLISWGQTQIESGLAAIFNSSTAIFGVLVAAIFLRDERLTPCKLTGVAIGFIGVATAIGLKNLTRFDPQSVGQLAVLGAALCYALAGVWAKTWLGHLPAAIATTGMLTASSLVLLPLVWWVDGPIPLILAPDTALAVIYMAILGTAMAYMLYYRILALAGAGNLMLVTLLMPPVGIVLGVLMRGETVAPRALLGFAILAVGLGVLDGRVFRWIHRA